MVTTILLVDDNLRFLETVKRLLAENPELSIVGEAMDGEQAVRLARELRPDVVLMDLSMPRMNGLEATSRIKSERPGTKVVTVTSFGGNEYRKAAAEKGADAFLAKKSLLTTLLPEILKVIAEREKSKRAV